MREELAVYGLIGDLFFLIWVMCWIIGGWWLSRAAFKLQPEEEGIVGLVVGLTAEIGLANFIGRVLSFPWTIWLSALVVFFAGMGFALRQGGLKGLKIKIIPGQWLAFIAITYIFFLVSRGLALYDDYAHLPTLSIMATGEIPPVFALNPDIPLRYHYFVLLFGAQIMRLTSGLPWTAWDIARSFTVAPAVLLGGLWAFRVTKNRFAELLGSAGVLFISGTRWLFLLLPDTILTWLSSEVKLIGAGAASGSTLVASLPNPWPVDGQGSFPFPYAFENGIFQTGAEVVHNVIGLMLTAVLFTLLLTATRWRNVGGVFISIILISSIGLLTEIELMLMAIAMLLIVLAWIIHTHSFKLPMGLRRWLAVWVISGFIIAVQGGAWTDTLLAILARLQGRTAPISYQVTGLRLASPSIVSNHLGVLSLLDIKSIVVALIEIGPILLVLPLIAIWGWKAARSERWFEATIFNAAILSLAMVFVHFSGSLRNSSRLYFFVPVCVLMTVSSLWVWASHRKRFIRGATGFLGGIVMFGGLIMLGVQFPNIKNHQFSFFITRNDVVMTENYWNKLEPDALVFDPFPNRATTILGRHTKTGLTWYENVPEFEDWVKLPDVYRLRKAGFSYAYFDQDYWNQLTTDKQKAFEQPCVVLIQKVFKPRRADWRKLYDIRACQ